MTVRDDKDYTELPPADSYLDDINLTEPVQDTAHAVGKRVATGYTAILGKIMHDTGKALLVSLQHLDKPVWIPLSQIGYIHRPNGFIEPNPDYTDTLHVADWLVAKNKLEE
jgi:hypothetical protein